MNGIIPRILRPLRPNGAVDTVFVVFAVHWLLLLPFMHEHTPGVTRAIGLLLLPACLYMAALTTSHMHALMRAVGVFGQKRSPATLWRQSMHAALLQITLGWLAVSAGAAVYLAAPASLMPWQAGPALASLVASMAAIRALAQAGMLARSFSRAVDIGAALAFAAAAVAVQDGQSLTLPAALLAALAFSWPVLALLLARHWNVTPPAHRETGAAARVTRSRLVHAIERLSVVPSAPGWQDIQKSAKQLPLPVRVGQLLTTAYPAALCIIHSMVLPARIDTQIGRTANIIFIAILMQGLVARDLHWRTFLAPGGMRRDRIASDLFVSTCWVQYAAVVLFAAVYAVFAGVWLDRTAQAIAHSLLQHARVLIEIAFSVAIALVARRRWTTAKSSHRWIAIVIGVAAFEVFARMTSFAEFPQLAPALYHALMVLATALMIWKANRTWTPAWLFPSANL